MSQPSRFRSIGLAAASLLFEPEPAAAHQDPTPPLTESRRQLDVPVKYRAPESCPDRDQFLSEVQRRITDPNHDPVVASISVEITEQNARFVGKVQFEDRSAVRSARNIGGERCDEVTSALALITALALQAQLPDEESPPDDVAPTPPNELAAEPVTESPSPAPARDRGLRLELGAQLGGASAYAPQPSLTLRAFVGAVTSHALFRLGVGYATRGGTERATGDADFSLLAARADICALLDERDPMTLGLCGAFELGYLRAAGTDSGTLDARQGGTLWAAPALLGQLRYAPSRSFRLELGAGAHFPLYREQFIFRLADGSEDEIHRIPGVGWVAFLGVAYVVQ